MKQLRNIPVKMSVEEMEKKAVERWDSIAAEPIEDHPIPEHLKEKLRKAGWLLLRAENGV